MKNLLTAFIILLFVISIFSINVIAKDDDDGKKDSKSNSDNGKGNSDSKSGSDKGSSNSDLSKTENSDFGSDEDSDEKVETKTIIDEQGRKVTVETKTETNGKGETETEEKRTFIDENGNKVVIETETEIGENGEIETEVKRKIITLDGREIVIKTKTEIEDGKTKTKNSIEVKGVEVETKLLIIEKFEDGQTKLKAKLSTGAEQEIVTRPDEVLKTALAEIGGKNITIELNEFVEANQRKAMFSAKTTNRGRFLGIFDTNVNLETLINTQTGKIIKTNRPWWAFLVIGYNKATICHVSDEDKNKRVTLEIAIPAVKAHLAHGDSVGECSLITEPTEPLLNETAPNQTSS